VRGLWNGAIRSRCVTMRYGNDQFWLHSTDRARSHRHGVVPGVVCRDLNGCRPIVAIAGGNAVEIPDVEVRRVHVNRDRDRVVARVVVGQFLGCRQDMPADRRAGSIPLERACRAGTAASPEIVCVPIVMPPPSRRSHDVEVGGHIQATHVLYREYHGAVSPCVT